MSADSRPGPPALGGRSADELVAAYVARRPGWQAWAPPGKAAVAVSSVEVLVPGRPGVVDLVADVAGRTVHLLVGLRPPGDEARFIAGSVDPVLGLYEDHDGLAVAFDALADETTATAALEAVAGLPSNTRWVRGWTGAPDRRSVAFDDRVALTVVELLSPAADSWLEVRLALDDAGCNHLPAPVATWRRHDRALGLVHELLPTATSGWSLALGSLRDLLAAGVEPEAAGGDFAAEASALGASVARLHLALDRAFGHWPADVAAWSATIGAGVARHAPELADRPDVRKALDDLATVAAPCSSLRSYGHLSLARAWRSDLGWYLADPGVPAAVDDSWSAGSVPEPADAAGDPASAAVAGRTAPWPAVGELRPPLADVADVLSSIGQVAAVALAEHGGADRASGDRPVDELVAAWERRNRRAFVTGYLAEPGIAALVPSDRRALRAVTAAFELDRAVRRSPAV